MNTSLTHITQYTKRCVAIVVAIAMVVPQLALAQVSSTNYDLGQVDVGPIEADATSTNYEIKMEVGAPAVGQSTSSNYIVDHGTTWLASSTDYTAPEVTAQSPASGATDVSVSANIVITVQDVAPGLISGLDSATCRIQISSATFSSSIFGGGAGSGAAFSTSSVTDGATFTINPDADFGANELVSVSVSACQDTADTPNVMTTVNYTFLTGGAGGLIGGIGGSTFSPFIHDETLRVEHVGDGAAQVVFSTNLDVGEILVHYDLSSQQRFNDPSFLTYDFQTQLQDGSGTTEQVIPVNNLISGETYYFRPVYYIEGEVYVDGEVAYTVPEYADDALRPIIFNEQVYRSGIERDIVQFDTNVTGGEVHLYLGTTSFADITDVSVLSRYDTNTVRRPLTSYTAYAESTSLLPGVTYYFRPVYYVLGQTVIGKEVSFTIPLDQEEEVRELIVDDISTAPVVAPTPEPPTESVTPPPTTPPVDTPVTEPSEPPAEVPVPEALPETPTPEPAPEPSLIERITRQQFSRAFTINRQPLSPSVFTVQSVRVRAEERVIRVEGETTPNRAVTVYFY